MFFVINIAQHRTYVEIQYLWTGEQRRRGGRTDAGVGDANVGVGTGHRRGNQRARRGNLNSIRPENLRECSGFLFRGFRACLLHFHIPSQPVDPRDVLVAHLFQALRRGEALVDLGVFQVLDVVAQHLVLVPGFDRGTKLPVHVLVRGLARQGVHDVRDVL